MKDQFSIFSDEQAIVATADSTKSILFPAHVGQSEPVKLDIRVMEEFTLLTDLTIGVMQTIESDTAFASGEIVTEQNILLADLIVGAKSAIRFLPNIDKPLVQLVYTVNGTNPDAGSIFAAVVEGEDFPIKDGMYYNPRNPSGAAATAVPS